MKSRFLVLCIALCGFALSSFAQIDVNITLVQFATGFDKPIGLEHAGDERLFVIEKDGVIRILMPNGSINSTPFLDMQTLTSTGGVNSEQGLLGLTFHPDYTTNGYFYVNYTMVNGDTRISRFTVSANPDVADATSRLDILTVDQPYGNHNGGCLKFGPDGYLYIGMGDGGSGEDPLNNGQSMDELLGKILRIDVNVGALYGIPADNPFIGASTDTLPEIWASGIRNPWRFSFDRETGDLWIGDVGQYAWEEVDFQSVDSPGGENYGWNCYEGNHVGFGGGCPPMSSFVAPVTEYSHASSACSVTGGYVYRGTAYPNLYGKYFFCDYCNGKFYSLERNDADEWVRFDVASTGSGWTSFGEDNAGEIYVVNQSDGKIYSLTDPCSTNEASINQDGNTLTATQGVSYQWYLNGEAIPGASTQEFLVIESGLYSVLVIFSGSCTDFSDPIQVTVSGLGENDLISTRFNSNPIRQELQVVFGTDIRGIVNLILNDLSGKLIMEEQVFVQNGLVHNMDASTWATGNYVLSIRSEDEVLNLGFVKQ
jgi:glucose/arabinose dehydrogenase